MARRKKAGPQPFGVPQGIVLLETPDGWRHTVLTADGGLLCGRLDVAPHTDPQGARIAAEGLVRALARDVHGAEAEVSWDPPQDAGTWTARITHAG
ncbi:hypothetical protein GCM10010329_57090 [Streptomyces spiroverticillatus]|uniref:Uncharacterized protein n=1 Tax=Streptomyces finlayi TaxID=67296 RepID=A0A918X383_9ACTN|nr:hypothetical protein [Streptomyces finlayi]GHA26462.1 hypothetical protein GCM10010329_57090 [Streptomyces spiroverticillatus]GHD07964.1 hypothetical protein GCM10010334_60760 [Streptomyces finlayi]